MKTIKQYPSEELKQIAKSKKFPPIKREILEIGEIVRVKKVEHLKTDITECWAITLESGNKQVTIPLSSFSKFLKGDTSEELFTSYFIVVEINIRKRMGKEDIRIYKFEKLIING